VATTFQRLIEHVPNEESLGFLVLSGSPIVLGGAGEITGYNSAEKNASSLARQHVNGLLVPFRACLMWKVQSSAGMLVKR